MRRNHHKFFIGITAFIMLIIGLLLSIFLAANANNLEMINLALLLTAIILLLMIGGLILEIKDSVEKIKKVK